MKNIIMILGANTLQLPLIRKANELGYETLVVSPNIQEPGHSIATYSEMCDVIDEKNILDIGKKYDICGVITDQTDLPVRTMAYVSERMNLPGNDYNVARLFTDKYLMREKCKEIGVKTVEYRLCHRLEEAEEFFLYVSKDVILKPVDNQGSKGVSRVSDLDDLKTKFNEAIEYSRSSGVLIEEYIDGQEFLVEGICLNYEFRNLCCGDTEYFDIPNVFSAKKREFPSIVDNSIVEKVLDTNKKIVEGFGLKQGITHGEYILCGDDVILLEIAARGGGVFISSDLINLQTGLDTEKYLLDIAVGNADCIPEFTQKNRSCCYISFFLPEGIISEVSGVDEVNNLPYTYHNNFETLVKGKKINKNVDKTSRFFVIVEAQNHDELMQRRDYIKKILKVNVVNEDGIIRGIIWD